VAAIRRVIAASFVKPVYYVRYVEFCLPRWRS